MISIKVIPKKNYLQVPWKNGQGITFEIARDSAIINKDFIWRLSMAEVTHSGPFSIFPNADRIIIQLEGTPIKLEHLETNKQQTLNLHEPYHFDGNWNTKAEVLGPGKDFNIISKKNAVTVTTLFKTVSIEKEESLIIDNDEQFIFCTSGILFLKDLHTMNEYRIDQYDTLRISNQKSDSRPSHLKLFSPTNSQCQIITLGYKKE